MIKVKKIPLLFSWATHLRCILFVTILGYVLLQHEYRDHGYFYFYFIPFQKLLSHATSLIVIPITIIFVIIGFLFLSCLSFKEDLIDQTRQTVLAGILIVFYCLILTIEADTKAGSFYNPLSNMDDPWMGLYVRLVVFFVLSGYYSLIFYLWQEGVRFLNRWQPVAYYLVALPFACQISPSYHFLAMAAGLLILFLKRHAPPYFSVDKFKTRILIPVGLFAIVVVTFLLRLWTLEISSKAGLMMTVTDGDLFVINSQDLWEGRLVPTTNNIPVAYSFVLYLFYHIVGFSLKHALMISGLLGALVPLLVFYIARTFCNDKTAFLAALCSAFSENLITFSVVAHRNGLASFFLTATVFCLFSAIQKPNRIRMFLFGFALGWTILLDGVLAPLCILVLFPLWNQKKMHFKVLVLSMFLAGLVLAQLPYQWRMINDFKTVLPLGRETAVLKSQWNYAGHEEGKILKEMGFDPFLSLENSLRVVLEKPGRSLSLLAAKSFKEL
jgi:hypothetical protein